MASRSSAHLPRGRPLARQRPVEDDQVGLAGGDIGSAFNLLSELPHLPGPDLLGQGDLDALLAITSAPPAPAPTAA